MKLPEGMTKKEHNIMIAEYQERMQKSQTNFHGFYNKIRNSRQAFIQEIPEDISGSTSNTGEVGNDDSDNTYQASRSAMLSPMFTAISVRAIEDLSAMPFRFEFSGNNRLGEDIRREIDKKLRSVYTQSNIDRKMSLVRFSFIVNGLAVTQTIYTNKTRKLTNGKTIKYRAGIDMRVYDPLQVYYDWNASITDFRNTSQFIIITIGEYTSEYVKNKYGVDVGGSAHGNSEDAYKEELQNKSGEENPDAIPVREYYTADGFFYTVVNDSYIVRKEEVSNGDADRIPINVATSFVTMDSRLGLTIWEKVKWPVAMMSNAINQIADNNAMNNNMPTIVFSGMNPEILTDETMSGMKIMEVQPVSNPQKTTPDIRKMIYRPKVEEVTPGAQELYRIGLESLYFNTGTSPMSFGVQDKQIRNEAVAGMVSQSLVRAESDIAKNIENGFINPTTWDMLQIFAIKSIEFNIKEDIADALLENIDSVRVVNGSYLPGDRMVRMQKLQLTIQMAYNDPGRFKLEEIMYDFFDALGFADPYMYIKSAIQMTKERLAMLVMQEASEGVMDENGRLRPEIENLINQIAMLVDQQEAEEDAR
jgi:hypothetical protein